MSGLTTVIANSASSLHTLAILNTSGPPHTITNPDYLKRLKTVEDLTLFGTSLSPDALCYLGPRVRILRLHGEKPDDHMFEARLASCLVCLKYQRDGWYMDKGRIVSVFARCNYHPSMRDLKVSDVAAPAGNADFVFRTSAVLRSATKLMYD